MSTPKGLEVADGLTLPLDFITQSAALLAVRRAGKSNVAAVMAEQMHRAGLPWVGIDPKGDWWGLRSDKAGTGPGLPIPIFGGLHGDMPLLPEAGHLIAELIADENLTCVLDVSEFASKAAQMRFLTDLAERLFRLHGKTPQPRHLFLEEADDFIPQRVQKEQARCVGAWTKLVKQGGSRGLGITLISQRSAVVNKDALTQTETLIALRTTSPQDRKAISDWVSYHAVARELVDSLPGLQDGEAWVCSPHWLGKHGQPAIQRVQFYQRSTFDSGATPTLRQRRKPAELADIDLGALLGRMEAVTEKAAQDDPAALRKRIATLERQIRVAKPASSPDVARLAAENADLRQQLAAERAREPEQVEVPVLQPGDTAAVEQIITALRAEAGSLELALGRASRVTPAPAPPAPPPVRKPAPVVPAQDPAATGEAAATAPLGRAARAVLTVLAQFPEGRTRSQVATLSGYSAKSSSMDNALSALRVGGFIGRGNPIMATQAGIEALGDTWEPLPTGAALIEHWMGRLGKAERAVLRALLDVWPAAMTRDQISEASGYSATSSSMDNALSKLRKLQLAEGYGELRADETLAEHAQGAVR